MMTSGAIRTSSDSARGGHIRVPASAAQFETHVVSVAPTEARACFAKPGNGAPRLRIVQRLWFLKHKKRARFRTQVQFTTKPLVERYLISTVIVVVTGSQRTSSTVL